MKWRGKGAKMMWPRPWGHAGAHSRIERFLYDHLDPASAAKTYADDTDERRAVRLPPLATDDWREMDDQTARDNILQAALIRAPVGLSSTDIAMLVSFLRTLDDETALNGRLGIPRDVPSGLPVGGAPN